MATVLEPHTHADDVGAVEAALIALDADFAAVYGPDMGHWSRGVLGEFLEIQRSRRTADQTARPSRPRKASAARRRRHRNQLGYRVHEIAPGAVTVLVTPVWTDRNGPFEARFVVTARTSDGQHLKLPRGGSRRLVALLQGVFPAADWHQPQTWHADSSQLTAWKAVA